MQKTILYAVLNWGLGHATRSIPIIKSLINKKFKLIIVSDGEALSLLQIEFPKLEFEKTIGYKVAYARTSQDFNFTLAKQIPKFIQAIKEEHKDCLKLCTKYQVDFIISDNRYGFFHPSLPSALLCHQLHLRYPESKLIEKIVNKSYQSYLKKFNQLWVPDTAPPKNISGEMSHLTWKNVRYIGLDSRFEKINTPLKYKYIAILSGPEPQRSLLESELLTKLNQTPGNHILIRGTTTSQESNSKAPIEVYDMAHSMLLNKLICLSETVICRSGYTSIVDLLKLDKNALIIPTPGQAEQEYLAQNMKKLNYFSVEHQGEINLESMETSNRPKIKFGYDYEVILSFLSC